MGSIASMLFGPDADRLLRLIAGDGGEERSAADRVLRSGEWCGSTPGRGSADRVAAWPRGDRRGSMDGNGRI